MDNEDVKVLYVYVVNFGRHYDSDHDHEIFSTLAKAQAFQRAASYTKPYSEYDWSTLDRVVLDKEI